MSKLFKKVISGWNIPLNQVEKPRLNPKSLHIILLDDSVTPALKKHFMQYKK